MERNSSHSWALVTGASSGIGLAYAEALAKQCRSVILVARNEHKLNEVAAGLGEEFGVETKVIAVDLSTIDGVNKVIDETEGLQVDLLINNAGKEESGRFLELDTTEMINSIALNCQAPLLLSHHFARKMASSGGGDILFLASIVAFQGVPFIANYAATKSYVLTFAEGIGFELKDKGVNVSIATPGFTKSNLAPDYNFEGTPYKPLEAAFVAEYTLDNLGKKRIIVPGGVNKVLFYLGKYLQPRKLNTRVFYRVFSRVLRDKLA